MLKPTIGLDDNQRKQSIEDLNRTLANESLLLVKTKKFHWDISGPQFKSLHELWDDQYATIANWVDAVAERARMLGGIPVGTMKGFLELSTLKEHPGRVSNATESVRLLLEDHETSARELRQRADACDQRGDRGTGDFLTQILQDHEKMAWMLRSFLEGEAVEPDGKSATSVKNQNNQFA